MDAHDADKIDYTNSLKIRRYNLDTIHFYDTPRHMVTTLLTFMISQDVYPFPTQIDIANSHCDKNMTKKLIRMND